MNIVKTFSADMKQFEEMLQFIRKVSADFGIPDNLISKITLASEEAIVNIIKYAYPEESGDITIECMDTKDNDGIVIKLSDNGIPFNPLEKIDPNIDGPIEERPIGGLGIFMIKKIMDDVFYRREDEKNILTLVKLKN